MKQITREVRRTISYQEAQLLCKSEKYIIKEDTLVLYHIKEDNQSKSIILKQYLKTENSDLLLGLFPHIDSASFNRSTAKDLLLKTSITSEKLRKYSIEEKEELVKEGYLEKKNVGLYIVYETISNQFSVETINPDRESYEFFLEKTKILLSTLGFKVMNLPWSVSYEDNFSFLNFKKDNLKVVSEKDNYYLGKLENEKSRLLKPHCTGIMLKRIKDEFLNGNTNNRSYYSISRVFRKENRDPTHSCFFDQLEITVITSKKQYSEILDLFTKTYNQVFSVLGITSKIEIYPTFYPYTTPSLQFYDNKKKLEIGGGGVFNFDFIPGKNAIGFALGLERCYMYKYGIEDIKLLK